MVAEEEVLRGGQTPAPQSLSLAQQPPPSLTGQERKPEEQLIGPRETEVELDGGGGGGDVVDGGGEEDDDVLVLEGITRMVVVDIRTPGRVSTSRNLDLSR